MLSPRKESSAAEPGLLAALTTRGGLLACGVVGVLALAASTAMLYGAGRKPASGADTACQFELRVSREGGGTEWVRITPRDESLAGLNLGAGVTLYEVRIQGCGPGTR